MQSKEVRHMSNNSKNNMQFILIAVIALVCAALIGVAIFFALSGDSDNGEPTADGTTEAAVNTPTDEKPSDPNGSERIENLPVQNDNVADDIFN